MTGKDLGPYMEIGRFTFHRRASTAFNELSSGDQARVFESLAPLGGTPHQQWPPRMVKKLGWTPTPVLVSDR